MMKERNKFRRNGSQAPPEKSTNPKDKQVDPAKLSVALKVMDENYAILRALAR